jgi:hypothetical protein
VAHREELNMKITRDVITDLWPVYAAKEASDDTCRLVDEYLAGDPEFARSLRDDPVLDAPVPSLPPEHAAASLRRTRDLIHGRGWLRGLRLMALVFTVFTIVRLIQDTTFVGSPTVVLGDALLATICWATYAFLVGYARRKALSGR